MKISCTYLHIYNIVCVYLASSSASAIEMIYLACINWIMEIDYKYFIFLHPKQSKKDNGAGVTAPFA